MYIENIFGRKNMTNHRGQKQNFGNIYIRKRSEKNIILADYFSVGAV